MESIKPKNAYFDTSGVYDSTMNDTQAEINSDMKFVDALDIRFPFMYLRDVGYGAVQGLCCVGDRYIIVARYRLGSTGAKDLMVFDIVTRKVIKSNIFSKYSSDDNKKVELGHLSSITYVRAEAEDKDYLYIPRKEKENDENGEDDRYGYILRLTIELNQNNENFGNIQLDKTFSYDITAPSNANIPYTPLCLAYTGNDFYFIASTTYNNRCYIYKISADFSQPTLAFMTTFDGLRAGHFARQGMTADGKYLYFSLAGYFNMDMRGSSDMQYGMREMQEIIITDFSGAVVKSLTFPRGEYGEIEDIDLITPPGSTVPSLVIACNQNDTISHFAPVYACQLYRNSKKSFYLLTPGSEGSLLRDSIQYRVYCDSSPCYVDDFGNVTAYNVLKSNPFATGLVQDKFTSIHAAIAYIKKLGVPVTLIISGKHGGMTYRGLRGINFVFDGNDTDGNAVNTEVADITLEDCYGISLSFLHGATHGTINTGNSILYTELGEPSDIAFTSGGLNSTSYTAKDDNSRIRVTGKTFPILQSGSIIRISAPYTARIIACRSAIYTANQYTTDWLSGDYIVPEEYNGYYFGALIRKTGYESDDISADVNIISDYVQFFPKLSAYEQARRKLLSGKKLSVMGDSMSAMKGYIPSGFPTSAAYYKGSDHGVFSVNQMWWSVLCKLTGMTPLVINAYSGSGVTHLEESNHDSITEMSHDSRCSGLGTTNDDPDVIIIAGGTNDYSWSQSAHSEPGSWDGKAAPVLGNSFIEAYACMIKKIRDNYPNAIIVCLSTWYTLRSDFNGYTYTHTSGSNIYTHDDYDQAIEKVCKLMRVPYINVNNVGFNAAVHYGQYASDDEDTPTHLNARGQYVIGKCIAEKIIPLVIGLKNNDYFKYTTS